MNIVIRLYKAFRYSCQGIHYAWRTQWAFRFEIFILILGLPCAIYLSHSIVEFILLINALILLPMLELFNSAIETTVNRISLERHQLSGLAKDLASAGMLVAGINAAIVWSSIIVVRFFV